MKNPCAPESAYLATLKLDCCCGGQKTLAEAAAAKSIELDGIVADLGRLEATAVRGARATRHESLDRNDRKTIPPGPQPGAAGPHPFGQARGGGAPRPSVRLRWPRGFAGAELRPQCPRRSDHAFFGDGEVHRNIANEWIDRRDRRLRVAYAEDTGLDRERGQRSDEIAASITQSESAGVESDDGRQHDVGDRFASGFRFGNAPDAGNQLFAGVLARCESPRRSINSRPSSTRPFSR